MLGRDICWTRWYCGNNEQSNLVRLEHVIWDMVLFVCGPRHRAKSVVFRVVADYILMIPWFIYIRAALRCCPASNVNIGHIDQARTCGLEICMEGWLTLWSASSSGIVEEGSPGQSFEWLYPLFERLLTGSISTSMIGLRSKMDWSCALSGFQNSTLLLL
jgi:hypothetical protein